jgi:hypothetical protein
MNTPGSDPNQPKMNQKQIFDRSSPMSQPKTPDDYHRGAKLAEISLAFFHPRNLRFVLEGELRDEVLNPFVDRLREVSSGSRLVWHDLGGEAERNHGPKSSPK